MLHQNCERSQISIPKSDDNVVAEMTSVEQFWPALKHPVHRS